MGVFKWWRRERVTVTTHGHEESPETDRHSRSSTHIDTIRTEKYKRDLAEFQARRSLGAKEIPSDKRVPVKKKCGRHSLPVSCTDCASPIQDHDTTFNYEKKSAVKYKKKTHKRTRSAADDKKGLPNIQFLFQNQVFMPGNYPNPTYTEPAKSKRSHKGYQSPEIEMFQRRLDFNEDQTDSPPFFLKNNSLPFDVKHFIDGSKSDMEEVDGVRAAGDIRSSHESSKTRDSEEKLWEVMNELKHFDQWADEQLKHNTTKSDDSRSDTSAFGLPVASASDLDVNVSWDRTWSRGRWGGVPVQVKVLPGVTLDCVRRRTSSEVEILRKCRHPNIILLMGVYPDIQNDVHLICERCVDTLHGILHVQGRILSAQTAVSYILDITNALVFLRMQGYIHTELNSTSVMITSHDTAKLADVGPCVRLQKVREARSKGYEVYSPEPQYVNIEATRHTPATPDSEPLLSQHPSEVYLTANSTPKSYKAYCEAEHYRWQAPELFAPDERGDVRPCSRGDVYSLCVMLWESCQAEIPFKHLSYDKLKESYISWETGLNLPQDGTYPGCLLALLQSGLRIQRSERIDLNVLQTTLHDVKRDLDDLEYIIIPARLNKKKSGFSSTAWDNSPTDDSECQSPVNKVHQADVHKNDTSTDSDKSEPSPLYETIPKTSYTLPEKCYPDENIEERPILKYELIPEKDFSSACSTPISKIRARIKDIGTPGVLHRSDSTEYCSILSPDARNLALIYDSNNSAEPPTAKLSRSFTPQSYKPLHIKVPEFNFDSVKSILKDRNSAERSSYNFDIKNYSLPTTPIARSNKLRKNAWLSGDVAPAGNKPKEFIRAPSEENKAQSAPETPISSTVTEKHKIVENRNVSKLFTREDTSSPESLDTGRDTYTCNRISEPSPDISPEVEINLERRNSVPKPADKIVKYKIDEDILANLSVKPLVAIHERWIYEANRKTARSMSLPDEHRSNIPAVKPASHCVDTLQKSLPQLTVKRPIPKPFRPHPVSPSNGPQWEQFCQARDNIAKNVNFGSRDSVRLHKEDRIKDTDKGTETDTKTESKVDRSTDTVSIEDFIRELIRKEFQHLIHEISDETKTEDTLTKGIANIVESLKNGDDSDKKETIKSFSRVKINGNNKPLLQITFSRAGENSLQVLDNCVNVTICDSSLGTKDKMNLTLEDTLTEDIQVHALKRCQAFNAIQEARSTEDLYIDDDLSTQMQENFGGKVKLIPLHGSLHEILCEKEDDCCLIKVKQENGCDTIYFRCDNSDTESRDAIDGCPHDGRNKDTVVFKRSISIEERIQRVFPKDKRPNPTVHRRIRQDVDSLRARPKSEVYLKNITTDSRVLSNSSPSLSMHRNDDVEVNIENVMSYHDSSSDECLRCDNDDFETLERKIEEDLATSNLSNLTCCCLEKISEENLSVFNDETGDNCGDCC